MSVRPIEKNKVIVIPNNNKKMFSINITCNCNYHYFDKIHHDIFFILNVTKTEKNLCNGNYCSLQ